MPTSENEVKPAVKVLFEELLQNYQEKDGFQLLVSHFGEFSQDLVNSLSEGIEKAMVDNGAKKNLTKRMFSVLIEGLQNLRIHGEKDSKNNQVGHLIIAEKDGNYTVSIGNLCLNDNLKKLTQHLDKLNAMSKEEVKDFYLEILSNGIMSDRGGAGLGFITIKLKSKSEIHYNFDRLNSVLSYFSMNISLSV